MDVFFTLFFNLLPLYGLIALGFFAGRVLHADRHTLANLAIYIFMPVVVFGFVINLDFEPSFIFLPILLYVVSAITGYGFLWLGNRIFGDNNANLMALCASMGNTGYFGLPLILLFFSEEQVAIYIFMMLGGLLYEATIGYYIAARGAFDAMTSVKKLVRFPTIYAISAGLAVNYSQVEMPEVFWTYWSYFKGAYVILGMMIVGAALSKVEKLVFGPRFLTLVFIGKFIAWPVLFYAFVYFDQTVTHWYHNDIHRLILIMSLVPPAANVAAYAEQMKLNPEKAATTILVGTLFALVYIPAMIWLLDIG